jgi:hypothetical protein
MALIDIQLQQVDKVAKTLGISREDVVVRALHMYLANCSDCGTPIWSHEVLCD